MESDVITDGGLNDRRERKMPSKCLAFLEARLAAIANPAPAEQMEYPRTQ